MAQPDGGLAVGGGANPQYLTLVDVNSLLEQKMKKLLGISKQFSQDPPFPPKVLGKELCLREFGKSLVDRAYTWYHIEAWVH